MYIHIYTIRMYTYVYIYIHIHNDVMCNGHIRPGDSFLPATDSVCSYMCNIIRYTILYYTIL